MSNTLLLNIIDMNCLVSGVSNAVTNIPLTATKFNPKGTSTAMDEFNSTYKFLQDSISSYATIAANDAEKARLVVNELTYEDNSLSRWSANLNMGQNN